MTGRILELKRWERVSYFSQLKQAIGKDGAPMTDTEGAPIMVPDEDGPEIRMDLKRQKRNEAKALRKVMVAAFTEFEKGSDLSLTASQRAAIMADVWEVVPEEQLRELFTNCVRNIDGLTIDNEAITRGADLLDEADDGLLLWVLVNLQRLASLNAAEVFHSASPRTSPVGAARLQESPASAAISTEQEAGREPSIVTARPATSSSSSQAPIPAEG